MPEEKAEDRKLTRIEQLEKRQAAVAAQLQLAKNREAHKEKKREQRRNFLVGDAVRSTQGTVNGMPVEKLTRIMDAHLTKPRDRELFGLEPLPETTVAPPASTDEPEDEPSSTSKIGSFKNLGMSSNTSNGDTPAPSKAAKSAGR